MRATRALDLATSRVLEAVKVLDMAEETVRRGGRNYLDGVTRAKADVREAKASLTGIVEGLERDQMEEADESWVRFWLAKGEQRVHFMESLAGVPMTAKGKAELLNGH